MSFSSFGLSQEDSSLYSFLKEDDPWNNNSLFFTTPDLQTLELENQEEEEEPQLVVHAFIESNLPAPIGIKKKSNSNNDWKNLNVKSPRKSKKLNTGDKVEDKEDGNEEFEVIECKGPNTILPSGRAQGERRYMCQGNFIHRATFWRHRKKGCPHMQIQSYSFAS
jgi:hypothetical protein